MSTAELQTIFSELRDTLDHEHTITPLHEPYFGGNEWHYVKDCLDTGWVSSAGKYVDRFEKTLADYTGAKHAIAVVNGTAALHISLLLSDVATNDEVLCPSLTFVATANAIHYCGAIPHFVDVSPTSLGIDVDKLDDYLSDIGEFHAQQFINKHTQRPIRAIVAMHTFGHPVDMEPLMALCDKYHLALVEDAAESLGSLYKGRHTGTFARLGAISFNGNKIVTTGGGGAILTNHGSLATHIRHITTTAKLPHAWEYAHDEIGFNYRMPNLNAALGLAQLEQLDNFVAAKRQLASKYQQAFADNALLDVFVEPEYARSNYWLNVLMLKAPSLEQRNILLEAMHKAGMLTRPAWQLMHQLPIYAGMPHMDLTESQRLEQQIICLPSSVGLIKT